MMSNDAKSPGDTRQPLPLPIMMAEHSLHSGKPGTLTYDLSRPSGPYASTMALLNCCVDDWWPEAAAVTGTTCSGGCPPDFLCNQ